VDDGIFFFYNCGHVLIDLQATKKIADAKLGKDFQAVLKEFQKAQRLVVDGEAAYAPFISQAGLPQR
jgi:syntaxin 7